MEHNMDDIEMEEAERRELEYQKRLSDDIKILMNNESFQRAILEGYIRDTSVSVGSSFSGSESEIESLKAISHLKAYLENSII
jgi:hypothetical protein